MHFKYLSLLDFPFFLLFGLWIEYQNIEMCLVCKAMESGQKVVH